MEIPKGSAKGNFYAQLESLLVVKYPVDDFAVRLINLALIEIYVDIGNCVVTMSQSMCDSVSGNVEGSGNGSP